MSFSTLPPEIRFQIYGYTTLLDEPFHTYRGLYLSCQDIKAEMGHECHRMLRSHILGLQQVLPADSGILVSLVDTEGSGVARNLKISLSTRIYAGLTDDGHSIFEELRPLFAAQFDSITFTYHEDSGTHFNHSHLQWLTCYVLLALMSESGACGARRINIELPPLDTATAFNWHWIVEDTSQFMLKGPEGWRKPDWIVRPGEKAKVTWERNRSQKPAVEVDRVFVLRGLQGFNHLPGGSGNEGLHKYVGLGVLGVVLMAGYGLLRAIG